MHTVSKRETIQLIEICTVFVFVMAVFIYATDKNLIFFDRHTRVTSGRWDMGEYKTCMAVAESRQAVTMVCDRINATTESFSVRFWGKLALSGAVDPRLTEWKCQKNSDNDPAFTCRRNAGTGEK
jgi:hypothetical protein